MSNPHFFFYCDIQLCMDTNSLSGIELEDEGNESSSENHTSLESITLQFQYTKLKTCKSEFTRINLRNGYLALIPSADAKYVHIHMLKTNIFVSHPIFEHRNEGIMLTYSFRISSFFFLLLHILVGCLSDSQYQTK